MANVAVAELGSPSITSPDTVYGPGAGHLDETGIGGNPYPYGECTWYVWQFYFDTQGVKIPGQLGNATEWVASAHREQWQVDDQPLPGKTVSWSAARYPPFGHVAIVWQVNGDGSFDVLEMNFTYYAAERPELAGKIDLRTVKTREGIQGFITPMGVTTATGQGNDLFSALNTPFSSIGDAIRLAGLQLEAEAMTAGLKATAMGQVALGVLVVGGGLTLGALTAYGGGRPAVGVDRAGRRLRRTQRSLAPRQPSPIGRRSYTENEQRWLSPALRRQLAERPPPGPGPGRDVEFAAARAENARRAAGRGGARPVDPGTALRAEIRQARAARAAAGPNSKAWVDATVRLRTAENRLARLGR